MGRLIFRLFFPLFCYLLAPSTEKLRKKKLLATSITFLGCFFFFVFSFCWWKSDKTFGQEETRRQFFISMWTSFLSFSAVPVPAPYILRTAIAGDHGSPKRLSGGGKDLPSNNTDSFFLFSRELDKPATIRHAVGQSKWSWATTTRCPSMSTKVNGSEQEELEWGTDTTEKATLGLRVRFYNKKKSALSITTFGRLREQSVGSRKQVASCWLDFWSCERALYE